jgi:hypothetical protein
MPKILKSIKKKELTKIINVRVSENERSKIKNKANRYSNGNLSAYMKYALINFTPKEEDLIEIS